MSGELMNLFNGNSDSDSSSFKIPPEEADELTDVDKEVWDASSECIIAFNRNGRLEYVNKTAMNEFGYSLPSDILGYDVSILFGGTEGEDDPLQLQKLRASSLPTKVLGQPQDGKEYTLHAKRKDGTAQQTRSQGSTVFARFFGQIRLAYHPDFTVTPTTQPHSRSLHSLPSITRSQPSKAQACTR